MDEAFWQARWRKNEIGFHEAQPNENLLHHFPDLGLTASDTVFMPLCGKSVDIDWLLAQGLSIIGIELNQSAIEEVFARLDLTPTLDSIGALQRYRAGAVTLFVGDIFELTKQHVGQISVIYDRAALIALPADMRQRYTRHLREISDVAPQFLVTIDYDQKQMDGPPFSVPEVEIREHYGSFYTVKPLSSHAITGPIAQRCDGTENCWHLSPLG